RRYPGGKTYAPVTGFYSLIYGATGIEQAENDFLSGNDNRLFTRRLSALLTGRDPRGGNVVLTLNQQAQATAVRGLGDRAGAVVAIDPSTGKILAMASTPSYDPNPISSHDPSSIRAAYNKLANDPDDPLLNRAINARYPPGSAFKVIVAAAALQNGRNPDTLLDCPQAYTPPGTRTALHNFGNESCGASKVTMQAALTPLQAAMIAAAVSNNGVLMTPYLVDRVEAPDLTVLDTTQPKELSTAVSPEVAGQLT